MPEPTSADVVSLFLQGARVVAEAIADPAVAEAWDRPSVLEEQLVSGLAGHLARGGVLMVTDYLDLGAPLGPVDFDSAGEYFAVMAGSASPDHRRAVRERGAAAASAGRDALLRTIHEQLGGLGPRLGALDRNHLVAVTSGRVMRLEDYLVTRVVEQTVHLDDLARSVDVEPWPAPEGAEALTLAVGGEVGRRTRGGAAMIRALYRGGFAEPALPVM